MTLGGCRHPKRGVFESSFCQAFRVREGESYPPNSAALQWRQTLFVPRNSPHVSCGTGGASEVFLNGSSGCQHPSSVLWAIIVTALFIWSALRCRGTKRTDDAPRVHDGRSKALLRLRKAMIKVFQWALGVTLTVYVPPRFRYSNTAR
jgi:hypothetical protein